MPFKSEKQRRWMHANEPEMAAKWEKEEKSEEDITDETQLTEKIIRQIVRLVLVEETTKQNSDFKKWHEEAIKHLTKDGYDPVKYEKGAKRSYHDGYTTMDYEIEWLARMGLL